MRVSPSAILGDRLVYLTARTDALPIADLAHLAMQWVTELAPAKPVRRAPAATFPELAAALDAAQFGKWCPQREWVPVSSIPLVVLRAPIPVTPRDTRYSVAFLDVTRVGSHGSRYQPGMTICRLST
jgi:hypothetical protein